MSKLARVNAKDHIYVRIVDVLNKEFGCNYMGYQRGYWKKKETNLGVWFPQSSRDPKDAFAKNGKTMRKWRNIFRADDCEIVEYWPDDKLSEIATREITDTRVVFAKFIKKSDYIFMGVYRYKGLEGTNARIYERISEEFDINEYERSKK